MMLEEKISQMKESFEGNTNIVEELQEAKENMEYELNKMSEDLAKKAEQVARLAEEKRQLEKQCAHLESDIGTYKDTVSKMNSDKERAAR